MGQEKEDRLQGEEQMLRNNSFFHSSKFHILLTIAFFFLFSFCSGILYTQTTNFKLDNLAYQINNYNKHYYSNGTKRSFVKIKKNDNNQLYNDLFSQFYYSDDSGSVRQYMDNDCQVFSDDGILDYRITLYSQSTFSITNEEAKDGGYRIDYGLFHAYFTNPDRSYLGIHFDCDSYVFISDTFANILLDYYNLPSGEEAKNESYQKLITEKQYAVLKVRIDNDTVVKLSINNIIYSSKRTGPRCLEFGDYFALVCFPYLSKMLSPCFEIDFKTYAYYITSVLSKTNQLGYNRDNSDFSFFTYNYENSSYELNDGVSNSFKKIDFQGQTSVVFSVLFYASLPLFSLVFFLITKKGITDKKSSRICILTILAVLIIYSILANFIYTCFAFSVVPLTLLLILFISKGGQAFDFKKFIARSKNPFLDETGFIEIQI